jgi:tetratricopeptide (TPR) repeat protein
MRTVIYTITLSLLLALPVAAQEKTDPVPFRTDSGLITAEYYLATGKYTQALDVIEKVLVRHPRNADALAYTGYAYEKLGDVKKARDYYSRALQTDPRHLGANKYMAGLYLLDNNLALALEQMQALRMVCGHTSCEELDELESDINAFKKAQATKPR